MVARTALALLALAGIVAARAQPSVWVDVTPNTEDPEPEEVEKRYTPELVEELESAKDDALLLYTEFSAKTAIDMKMFIKNMSALTNETIREMDPRLLENASESCRTTFLKKLNKIAYDAQRAASFSGENHHKFFLGHMIVFRMHLNKSEDYIKRSEKLTNGCGIKCETTPKIRRWRRLAAAELHRVLDDLQHSRRSYHDLLAHAHRRLNTLRKRAKDRASDAVYQLEECAQRG